MRFFKVITTFAILTLSSSNVFAGDGEIVEWVPFVVKDGINSEKLISAAQKVESGFLKHQKGYIKRALLKGKDSNWVDVVYWKTEKDADAAATVANQSPICFEFFSLMKDIDHAASSAVQHYKVIRSWQ
ncbi:MAG: hypothetical protein OEW08_03600 [Gammaproteobacteria bacterium]|nr:hypothetical protein [Gammaproteobacteria bacterium]